MKFEIAKELPQLDVGLPLFCDIETDGLYINTRLVQVLQTDLVYILDTDILDLEEIKLWLQQYHTVFYNGAYDLGTLNIVPAKYDDLFYAVKTAYPEFQDFKLDNVVSKLGYDKLYQGLDKKELQKHGFKKGAYLSQRQLRYAATDVYALKLIYEHAKVQQVIKHNLSYKVDCISQMYAIEYQQNGLPVDQPLLVEQLQQVTEEVEQNKIALAGLNPNSPKQCKEALGVDSTNKQMLIKLIADGNQLAKLIFEQRRKIKRKTMLENYNYPRVYTRYNVAGASTGRFTATGGDLPRGINSQQRPRELKKLFVPTTPGMCLIAADYKTLELRLACAIYNEPYMYNQLKEGKDLHTETAMLLSGKSSITPEERQNGKAINFGLVFGMSAPSLQEYAFTQYGVKMALDEAREYANVYFRHYKGFKAYHRMVWEGVKKNNYIYTTALGRRVKPRLGTDGINGPVQGSGAETTKLAIHYLVKEDINALSKIVDVVHDAIYLEVHEQEVDEWSAKLKKAMLKGWEEISKTDLFHYKDIPMEVDIDVYRSRY